MARQSHEPGGMFMVGGGLMQVVSPGPRIAILGDVHGNLPAFELSLADIRRRGADLILCTGDLVGYGPWPRGCIELLSAAGIASARGNYDTGAGFDLSDCGCAYQTDRERETGQISLSWTQAALGPSHKAVLREMPALIEVVSDTGTPLVTVFHGSPRRINEYLYESRPQAGLERLLGELRAPVAVCGHTHLPYVRQLSGGNLLVNCGSAGRPKHGCAAATYAWLDFSAAWGCELRDAARSPAEARIIELPYPAARTAGAVRASGLPEDFARVILSGGAH